MEPVLDTLQHIDIHSEYSIKRRQKCRNEVNATLRDDKIVSKVTFNVDLRHCQNKNFNYFGICVILKYEQNCLKLSIYILNVYIIVT